MSAPRDDNDESAEDVARRASTTLALLIRFAQAEMQSDHAGHDYPLEEEAWWAIEHLLLTTRNDVKRLEALADGENLQARIATRRGKSLSENGGPSR